MEQVTGQMTEPVTDPISVTARAEPANPIVHALKQAVDQTQAAIAHTFDGVTQTTGQLVQSVTDTTVDTTQHVTTWTEQVFNGITQLPGQAAAAIAGTADKTKTSASQLGHSLTVGPQNALETMIQTWMLDHPVLAWFLTHPLITIGVGLVALVIIRRLLGATMQLTENILLAIVRSPLLLGKWLVALGAGILNRPVTALVETGQPTQQQRLATLLDRLEAIKQEQDEVLREVRSILDSGQ